MDNWDPMAGAYNDKKFNSYTEGVGRDLIDSSGNAPGAQLFVGQLPKNLGNEGLFNLFAEYGTVVEAKAMQSDRETTFGFVTMASPVEGERAITKLHNKKIGKSLLRVSVALTREEKERRKQAKEKESEFMYSLKRDFNRDSDNLSVKSGMSGSGKEGSARTPILGGKGQGIENIDRGEWHSLSQSQPGKTFPKLSINIGRGAGRQIKQLDDSVSARSQGRGTGSARPEGPVKPVGVGRGSNVSSQRPKVPNVEKRPGPSFFYDMQVPENSRLKGMKCCTLCLKEGCENLCSRCRMYYCSVECQKRDWPNHKDICTAFGEYYKMKGDLHSVEKQNKTAIEETGYNYETDTAGKTSQAYKSPSKKMKGVRKYDSDNSNSQEESNAKKPLTGPSQKGDYENEKKFGNSGLPNVKPEGPKVVKDDVKGPQNKPNRNEQDRAKEAAAPRRDGKQEAGDWGQSKKEQGPGADNTTAAQGGAGDATYGQVQMSIPVGSSGMAYLTYYENPYKFWISLVEHLEEFTETTALISKQASCSPPSSPKPTDTYGVMWEGEWARVEVISLSGEEVTVFFMDYGNTGVVKIKDLRPLTVDIIKLPAQALCCCVSKMKPEGGAWSETAVATVGEWFGPPMTKYFSFQVMEKRASKIAVKVSMDNEALSELLLCGNFGERDTGEPGLPSIMGSQKPTETVRFTIKELKTEMGMAKVGEQLSTAVTDFQSLKNFVALKQSSPAVLEELEAVMAAEFSEEHPCYRPSVGEVVAAIYSADMKWYRAQVRKVQGDTCSLFFVDFGNEEDQVVQNLREIKSDKVKGFAAQALVCCLHGLDTFAASVSEDELATKFAELLPSFMVDETWTLLSVKAKKEDHLEVDVISTKGLSLTETLKSLFPEPARSTAGASPLLNKPSAGGSAFKSPHTLPSLAETKKAAKTMVELKMDTLPISPDKMVSVTIPYVHNCGQFYVRRGASAKEFESMLQELNKCVRQEPVLQEAPTVGNLVAVQFSADKLWYRGRILKVESGGRCRVTFVDYGNSEVVPWAELRELAPAMCELPSQAIRCRLAGDVENLPAVSHIEFKQYLENETVEVKVLEGDVDSVSVQLYANGTDINALFFGTEKPEESTARKVADLTLDPGVPIKVECVNMASPASFHVQITSQVMASMEATLKLKTRLETAPQPVSSVAVGDFVASRFSQDDDPIWYRGRVDKVDGDKATIFFLDYGNFEERPKAELMCLSEEDLAVPAGTIKCQLKSCEKSTSEMDAKFSSVGQSQIDSIQVIKQTEEVCVVDVFDCNGKNITAMFTHTQETNPAQAKSMFQASQDGSKPKASVAPQTAASSPTTSSPAKNLVKTQSIANPNKLTSVTVTHIDSCSSLYVMHTDEDLQAKLLELMLALNMSAESLPPLHQPRQGSFCAACFSQDGSWYRARVLSLSSSSSCIVQFIDYGNSEETLVSGLRDLSKGDASLTELPAQAIKCCLSGFEVGLKSGTSLNGPSGADLDQLKAELLEKPVNMKVVKTVDDTLVVEMENEHQQSINEMLKPQLSVTEEGVPKLSDLIYERASEKEFDALFLQLTNLDEFYCHRCNEEEMTELMMMGELLQADVSQLPADTQCSPVVEGLYASEFQGVWYRCVVEKIVGSNVVIRYIDFGNCEEKPMSELKPLNKKRLLMPVRLLKCKLHGVTPKFPHWKHADMPDYLKLLSEKQPRLKVHGEQEGDSLLVSLLISDGQGSMLDVAQDLVSIGMATESTGEATTAVASGEQNSQAEDEEETEEAEADEMALAKQIQELQRQLELTKLKKAKGGKK